MAFHLALDQGKGLVPALHPIMERGKKAKSLLYPNPQSSHAVQATSETWLERRWTAELTNPDDPTYMCWEKMKLLDLLGQYMILQPFPADLMWMKLHQTEVVSICYQELDWRDVSLSPRCASSGVNGKL